MFKFIDEYRQHREIKQLKSELFKTKGQFDDMADIAQELSDELHLVRGKMFEYKTQVMHLNRVLAKKNRKVRNLQKQIEEGKPSKPKVFDMSKASTR
jgi:chromosome segregation ATPase